MASAPSGSENTITTKAFKDEDQSIDGDFDFDQDPEESLNNGRRRRRLWRLLRTPVITVLVGQEQTAFYVHRGLLRRHSHFFRGLLRSSCVEQQQSAIELPEDDILSFAAFVEWLYTGDCDTGSIYKDSHGKNIAVDDSAYLDKISTAVFAPAEEDREERNGKDEIVDGHPINEEQENDEEEHYQWEASSSADYDHYDFSLQFSCYVLADKLQAPGFKRCIIEEIHHYGEFCDPSDLSADQIRYVYNNTCQDDDLLRRFCVHIKCRRGLRKHLGDMEFLKLCEDGGPFVAGVLQACRKQIPEDIEHELEGLKDDKDSPKAKDK